MDVSHDSYYQFFDRWLRSFSHMNLARWKLVQNTLISLFVLILAVKAGADPTMALVVIALINGLSVADLAALWGVSVEIRGQDGPTVTVDREIETENEMDTSDESADKR